MEDHHDAQFERYRLKHFHRFRRAESAQMDDLFRDPNPESKAVYFPGKDAPHDAKCAWAGVVVEEECAGNDMRPAFRVMEEGWDIPSLDEVGSVILNILMACDPDTLSVCLYIDRKMIDTVVALAVVREEKNNKG